MRWKSAPAQLQDGFMSVLAVVMFLLGQCLKGAPSAVFYYRNEVFNLGLDHMAKNTTTIILFKLNYRYLSQCAASLKSIPMMTEA